MPYCGKTSAWKELQFRTEPTGSAEKSVLPCSTTGREHRRSRSCWKLELIDCCQFENVWGSLKEATTTAETRRCGCVLDPQRSHRSAPDSHFHTCTINQGSTSETDTNAARLPLCTFSEREQMWKIMSSVTDKVRRPQKTKKSEHWPMKSGPSSIFSPWLSEKN